MKKTWYFLVCMLMGSTSISAQEPIAEMKGILSNVTHPRNVAIVVAPESSFDLDEDGDYIYATNQRKSWILNGKNSLFTLTHPLCSYTYLNNDKESVSIYCDSCSFEFAAPKGNELKKGFYKNAVRCAFHENKPGLDIHGDGFGYGHLSGEFEVLEIVYGVDGKLSSFAANFVQGAGRNALFGTVRYNSSLPISTRFLNPPNLETKKSGSVIFLSKKTTEEESKLYKIYEEQLTIGQLPYGGEGISFIYDGEENGVYSFAFEIPKGKKVQVGLYTGAKAYPFQPAENPGIEVLTPEGIILVKEAGFRIWEHNVSEGKLTSFAADYEIESENGILYQGAIRYKSKIPADLDL